MEEKNEKKYVAGNIFAGMPQAYKMRLICEGILREDFEATRKFTPTCELQKNTRSFDSSFNFDLSAENFRMQLDILFLVFAE